MRPTWHMSPKAKEEIDIQSQHGMVKEVKRKQKHGKHETRVAIPPPVKVVYRPQATGIHPALPAPDVTMLLECNAMHVPAILLTASVSAVTKISPSTNKWGDSVMCSAILPVHDVGATLLYWATYHHGLPMVVELDL